MLHVSILYCYLRKSANQLSLRVEHCIIMPIFEPMAAGEMNILAIQTVGIRVPKLRYAPLNGSKRS